MKKAIFAVLAMACSMFGAVQAQTVVGSDGVKVLGGDTLLAVRANGSNAEAMYAGAWQPIADSGGTKVAKLIAACGAACITVDGNYGIAAVAVGRSNGVYCISNKSTIAFPNSGQPIEIADSCAFWQKVKANSQ